MRYELFIGLRYLRAKRREGFISLITLISTIGVAIGVMTLNIVLAVMTGFEEDLRDRILQFSPHVLVWSENGPVEGYAPLIERLRELPGVERASPFIYSHLMLSTPERVSGALVRGVVPSREAAVDLAENLQEGDVEELGRVFTVPLANGLGATVEAPGIILGSELAKQLEVEIGDTVSVALPLGSGGGMGALPRFRRFVLVGRFHSGMPEYDNGLAYVSLSDGQKLFDLGESVTGLQVWVDDIYTADQVASEIRSALGPGYLARDWMEANRNLFTALKLQKTVYSIVLLLIILVAAFTVLATLIMVVMEKRKDIAILMSMGASRSAVGRIFIFKGLVIGALGTILGNIGGYVGCWALRRYQFVDLPADVFIVSTVPVKMYAAYFAAVSAASLLICLLATIYPARKAGRLVPVEIIRYD